MAEGRKDDAGKPRPTLVQRDMANALQQVLQVAEYGARKYAPGNWLQVPDAVQRYTDAMLRHQQAHLRGEVRDPESGLPHMAHAAWCALAVLELGARKRVDLRRRVGLGHLLQTQTQPQPQLSDRAAFEERWAEDARLYWRSIDWASLQQRKEIESAELAAVVRQVRKDVGAHWDLRNVNRQLRKDPEVRRILNTHGTRLVRTASGSILAGNVVIMGPERTPAEYRKGREAIRRLERATHPLGSLVRGVPLYEAAFAEGLLYLQGPTTIAIKDRRGQKLREVHGNTLLSAWALLKQMPDVENLLKLVTMRVPARPARPSREEYWRAELAKDPVCAEGLAKGWLRVARRGALIVEVIRTPAPTTWRYAREPVTPADMIDWVKRVRTEPHGATQLRHFPLRDLVYMHPDTRLRQLFDAGKLTCQSTETGGWRVTLGSRTSTALTLKAAFEALVSDAVFVEQEAAQPPKDRAIAHWTQELSRDPICARMLATRQLQLIHEPRTMLLKFRNSMLPLHAPHCTADEAIRWVHDGLRT